MEPIRENPAQDRLSQRDFERLGAIIQAHCGIRMPPSKKVMVEGRLRRRVRALELDSLKEYCRHLLDDEALKNELVELIDAVTTNKTDFFREKEHFAYLADYALPALMAQEHRPGRDGPLHLWSAACSIGAEPYTLAMVLREHGARLRGFQFGILATDICTDALAKAKLAIYPEEMAATIPADMAARYVLRSRDRNRPTIRMVPSIRQDVRFGHLNLMDPSYPVATEMDVIFCRNILIYFDKPTQQAVLKKLCGHLHPGGYLFVGHSETVSGFDLPLRQVATSVFTRI